MQFRHDSISGRLFEFAKGRQDVNQAISRVDMKGDVRFDSVALRLIEKGAQVSRIRHATPPSNLGFRRAITDDRVLDGAAGKFGRRDLG